MLSSLVIKVKKDNMYYSGSRSCTSFLFLVYLFSFRVLDFTLCLKHRSLPSQLSPKKSLILPAAKIRKPPLVLVRVVHSTQKVHHNSKPTTCYKFVCLFVCFVFPVQSQPGSGQGSPQGLDQVPSPQSLISGSSTPLVKNEPNQVCVYVS